MLFTFTADYEEPCCAWCDFQNVCPGSNIKCGPEYGWLRYQRTVDEEDATPLEQTTINLISNYLEDKGEKI